MEPGELKLYLELKEQGTDIATETYPHTTTKCFQVV